MNNYLIIGTLLTDPEIIIDNLLDNNKIFFIDFDQTINFDHSFGKFIDINEFYTISNINDYSKVFVKNPIIIKNNSNISIPKGHYQIFSVDMIQD